MSLVHQAKDVAAAFSKAATTYDAHADLQRQVGQMLLDKLPLDLTGKSILDLGCGTGYFSQKLLARGANVTAFDLSESMLAQCKIRCDHFVDRNQRLNAVSSQPLGQITYQHGDAAQLNYHHDFDYVFSSLALQWCSDLTPVFIGIARSLKPDGQLLFTSVLEGSLAELKSAWAMVDKYQHVNAFQQINDIKIALAQTKFNQVELNSVSVICRYASAFDLLHALKGIGATSIPPSSRYPGLMKRRHLMAMQEAYHQGFMRNAQIPATYQICVGQIS
ncbi:MAG: malonyl-ACP O-methyltransferase BioC [Vibrio sp.]